MWSSIRPSSSTQETKSLQGGCVFGEAIAVVAKVVAVCVFVIGLDVFVAEVTVVFDVCDVDVAVDAVEVNDVLVIVTEVSDALAVEVVYLAQHCFK
jgi:hypothetical protein